MGKKSLIKSTSKKKPAAKMTKKKKTPAKKVAQKSTAKPKAKKKPAAKKAVRKPKAISTKDLLKKKFETETPKVLYTVPEELVEKSKFTAPDLLAGAGADDAKRIKSLLANRYSDGDLKAAAEKAAAEKATAEKATAEKATAEKAAAEKAAVIKTVSAKAAPKNVPAEKTPSNPIDNSIKLFAAVLAFLILLVIWGSVSNSLKYYAIEKDGALEIWKGTFAPIGKKIVVVLPGYQSSMEIKDTYRSHEVLSMIFQYYIDKADSLLDVPDIPEFEEIRANLKIALSYAPDRDMKRAAYERLDNIDRLILTYKAETAAMRGTVSGLTAAIGYLKEARKLSSDKMQKASIDIRIKEYEAARDSLKKGTAVQGHVPADSDAQQAKKSKVEAGTDSQDTVSDNAMPEAGSEKTDTQSEQHR